MFEKENLKISERAFRLIRTRLVGFMYNDI